jgi:nitroimidazol reductase NimA-like FMN-containing flavoprotein (pyridoxamine 5'-phosphate oxidase superfamily)
VNCTILDGLVLARSAFHHSVNYRSVVLFGTGRTVEDPEEKSAGFEALVEKIMPGRWNDTRQPNENEFRSTALVALSIESASAKVRTGPPLDDERDLDLPHWAGVLPLTESPGEPVPDPALADGIAVPDYVTNHR